MSSLKAAKLRVQGERLLAHAAELTAFKRLLHPEWTVEQIMAEIAARLECAEPGAAP